MTKVPVYFHPKQLLFAPPYEWDVRGKMPHPETPDRARTILAALQEQPERFEIIEPAEIPLEAIEAVHTPELLQMLHTAERLDEGVTHFITFFPKSTQRNADPANIFHAGFFCFDTSSPLSRETWTSAAWSAASAVAGAQAIHAGETLAAYALCRPPGHHADSGYFGGYCYLNNAAIAATWLKQFGPIAVVDIDFHHGDGTQSIFYQDSQVLTASLHADPHNHYPYYSGHDTEIGWGSGTGYNINVPLPTGTGLEAMLDSLNSKIIPAIEAFLPNYLVVSIGLDTFKNDPLGDFTLSTEDYIPLGKRFGEIPCPILVIQEGGYQTVELGHNIRAFLQGLQQGKMEAASQ